MTHDWQAVGNALAGRLEERGMTMTELASRSGVSLTTVRELVHVLNTRRRQPRTLIALSEALGWPNDHLGRVLRNQVEVAPETSPSDELSLLREEVRDLRAVGGLQEQIVAMRADLDDVHERLDRIEAAQRRGS